MSREILACDFAGLHFLASKVLVCIDVFGALVEIRVHGQSDQYLIVVGHLNRIVVVENVKFTSKQLEVNNFLR